MILMWSEALQIKQTMEKIPDLSYEVFDYGIYLSIYAIIMVRTLAVQFLGHKRQQEAVKKRKCFCCRGTQFCSDKGLNLYPSVIFYLD